MEQCNIQRFQAFKIKVSVRIFRGLLPVQIIIIQRQRMRFQPQCRKLYRKPMGKSRFSGRRGTCNHNKFTSSASGSHFCHLSDSLFHQSFLHHYDLLHPSGCDRVIQRPDRIDSHGTAPFPGTAHRIKMLHGRFKFRRLFCIFIGEHQHKTVFIGLKVKILQISRMCRHITVKVILIISQRINTHSGTPAVMKQALFFRHSVITKQLYGIVRLDAAF